MWYNTDIVQGDDIPTNVADVADPKWNNQIAVTPYVSGYREAGGYFGELEYWKDFLIDLRESGNIAGYIRCGEAERIASGEFAMLAVGCSNGSVRELIEAGAPIDYVVPADQAIVTYVYTAIPKGSPHPALAKLFALYLLTPEAQAVHWKHYYTDLHLVEGSQIQAEIDAKAPPGVAIKEVTPEMVATFTEEFAMANEELAAAARGGG